MPIQIKPVIVQMMAELHPGFSLVRTTQNRYFFQSVGQSGVIEYVVFQRDGRESLYVDLAVTYEPKWEGFVPGLGTWASLAVVSGRNPRILGEKNWYRYGPSREFAREAMSSIGHEIAAHALPWFDQQ